MTGTADRAAKVPCRAADRRDGIFHHDFRGWAPMSGARPTRSPSSQNTPVRLTRIDSWGPHRRVADCCGVPCDVLAVVAQPDQVEPELPEPVEGVECQVW
jgi:hypothetical protein